MSSNDVTVGARWRLGDRFVARVAALPIESVTALVSRVALLGR